jgi:hypothetical protein
LVVKWMVFPWPTWVRIATSRTSLHPVVHRTWRMPRGFERFVALSESRSISPGKPEKLRVERPALTAYA